MSTFAILELRTRELNWFQWKIISPHISTPVLHTTYHHRLDLSGILRFILCSRLVVVRIVLFMTSNLTKQDKLEMQTNICRSELISRVVMYGKSFAFSGWCCSCVHKKVHYHFYSTLFFMEESFFWDFQLGQDRGDRDDGEKNSKL